MKNLKKPKKMILTAGPSITSLEVKYVSDAVKTGWNRQYRDYTNKFEKAFGEYVGVKYALATSGGTGALWLSLAAAGVGPGDEVILPEITYFACSDVIVHRGATPVFVDILPDTWCIDPDDMARKITKKTKAIMPVYLYGNLPEMDEIMRIAKKHALFVVEDACPAVGSYYKGKHAGSFGDCGAFSFQGAKIMVTGFGGMFVTNNKKLFERVSYLNAHAEDPHRKFWQTGVGYTFELPNVTAALGLAQLERIDELVKKKRQIFDWYNAHLSKIDGISINTERKKTKSNKWMTSFILNKKFKFTRDKLIAELKKYNIDSRPFFYPISSFPMYKNAHSPIAYHTGLNGINLPSGYECTKKEIDYICAVIKYLLS